MICEKCEKKAHSFNLQCLGCRDRLIMGIDCKVLREIEAKYLDIKFGFLPDYKKEPHCGCTKVCLRKSRLREQ